MELGLITTHHAVNLVTHVVIASICLHGPLLKLRIYLYESAIISVQIMIKGYCLLVLLKHYVKSYWAKIVFQDKEVYLQLACK